MPAVSRPDAKLEIRVIRAEELESFLPLIEDYQRFYQVPGTARGRNRGFFGRLIAPSQFGLLLGAWRGEIPIGYACLHWTLDSVAVRETVTLNDLWVIEKERGAGVGRALIAGAADHARARGAQALVWETAPDNYQAQRLYDSLTSKRDTWIHYELPL